MHIKKFSLKDIDWNVLHMPFVYSTFGVYVFLLVWIIIFKCTLPNTFSTDFISKSIEYRFTRGIVPLSYSFYTYQAQDIILNVLVFLPLGIYLPFMLKKWWAFLIIPAVSILFEVIQLLTGFGWFDTMDIISNVLGGYVGVGIYVLLRPRIKDKIINKINFIATVVFGLVAVAILIYLPLYFTIGDPYNEDVVYY